MKPRTRMFVVPMIAVLALNGCEKKPASTEGGSTKTVAKAGAADWCAEHGVPESVCTRCHPKLIAEFKQKGDWCKEHGVPESQCIECDPSLKEKFQAMAPKR